MRRVIAMTKRRSKSGFDEPVPAGRRYGAAVTGLALASLLAGAGLLVGGQMVFAEDSVGIYQFFRQDAQRRAPQRAAAAYAPGFFDSLGTGSIGNPPAERSPGTGLTAPGTSTASSRNTRTVCVRMCDGYQFPIGDLRAKRDLPVHESACSASCPGAPTKLFTVKAGAETIDDARAEDGTRYADIPMAYAALKRYEPTCSCQGPGRRVADRLPITKDMTLRRGDVVVTNVGALVFDGASKHDVTLADFKRLASSAALNKREKAEVAAQLGPDATGGLDDKRQAAR